MTLKGLTYNSVLCIGWINVISVFAKAAQSEMQSVKLKSLHLSWQKHTSRVTAFLYKTHVLYIKLLITEAV